MGLKGLGVVLLLGWCWGGENDIYGVIWVMCIVGIGLMFCFGFVVYLRDAI